MDSGDLDNPASVASAEEWNTGGFPAEGCACCGRAIQPRHPDPWEGRMDAYCYDCALSRCDAYPGECPVKLGRPFEAA